MYKSPDFIKVAVKVEDSFAAYNCPPEESHGRTVPCGPDSPGYHYQTYLTLFPASMWDQCYLILTA